MSTYFKSNEVRIAHNRTEILAVYYDTPDFDETGPFMSNEEVLRALLEHSDACFSELPRWLQQELRSRHITFKKRAPTAEEVIETEHEAFEERKATHKLTINDLWSKYR